MIPPGPLPSEGAKNGDRPVRTAGIPEDKACASAKAIEEASRVSPKLRVLMWIGGILAGGGIAGFASGTTQLIRLTAEMVALAHIVRGMAPDALIDPPAQQAA